MNINDYTQSGTLTGIEYGTATGFGVDIAHRSRDPNVTHVRLGPEFQKAEDGDAWIIEGYASTDSVDEYNEIIEAEAYRKFLPRFQQFPIALLNHLWFEVPVGQVLSADIRENGLWVRIEISKSAPAVWQLIQEGTLKAFSVGFQGRSFQDPDPNSPGSPGIWKEIELVEISIVNVPANREALFTVAASKGISLTEFTKSTIQPTTTKKEGAGMDITAETLTQEVKTAVGSEVKALTPTIEAAATSAVESKTKSALVEFTTKADDVERQLKEMLDAVGNCQTKAESEEMKKKLHDDFSALMAQAERVNRRGLELRTPIIDVRAPDPQTNIEKAWAMELTGITPGQIRMFGNTPTELFYESDERHGMLGRLHELADYVLIEHLFMAKMRGANYGGPKTLKSWSPYSKLYSEFRKAMDTATSGQGTEWIPTNFSASMTELIEIKSNIAPLFRSFQMPTKVFEWPLQTSRATAYLIGESTADAATAITASTSGTSKTTFTAKKLAVRQLTSTELVEDSVVSILPFIRDDIAKTQANGQDNAIINGDTAATHMDADITDAKDVAKAWLGIRAYNKDNSKETDESGASNTLAALRADRKTMGVYGVDPDKLAFILSISEYFDLLDDTGVTTIDTFGPMATILKGKLAAVDGVTVKTTQHLAEDLNASGVNDGVIETYTVNLVVNTEAWMIGDRRLVQVDMEKIIETDQFQIVATCRKDFEPMHGTDSVSWTGYKVTP